LYILPLSEASTLKPDESFFQDPATNTTYALAVYNYRYAEYQGVMNDFITTCNATISRAVFNFSNFENIITHTSNHGTMLPNELDGFNVLRMIGDLPQLLFESCLSQVSEDFYKDEKTRSGWWGLLMFLVFAASIASFRICIACFASYENRHYRARLEEQLFENDNNQNEIPGVEGANENVVDDIEVYAFAILIEPFQARLETLPEIYRLSIPEELRNSQGLIMNDPVTVSFGVTFDRADLRRQFSENNNSEIIFCGATREPVFLSEFRQLKTNINIKRRIEAYLNSCSVHQRDGNGEFVSNTELNDSPSVDSHFNYDLRLQTVKKNIEFDVPEELACMLHMSDIMDAPQTLLSGVTLSGRVIATMVTLARDAGKNTICCPATRIEIPISYCEKLKTDVTVDNWIKKYVEEQEIKNKIYIRNIGIFNARFPQNTLDRIRAGLPPINTFITNVRNTFLRGNYNLVTNSAAEFKEDMEMRDVRINP
jgi:hypothetical protein